MNQDFLKLTGLQKIQLILEGKIPPPSMGVNMGQNLVEAREGFARMELRPDDRHLNPMGGVHGGLIATALDSVTGISTHTVLESGEAFGTIDLNVKMLRPLKVGGLYFVEGTVISRSRSLTISEGKVYDESGKIYGYGSATCMVIRP